MGGMHSLLFSSPPPVNHQHLNLEEQDSFVTRFISKRVFWQRFTNQRKYQEVARPVSEIECPCAHAHLVFSSSCVNPSCSSSTSVCIEVFGFEVFDKSSPQLLNRRWRPYSGSLKLRLLLCHFQSAKKRYVFRLQNKGQLVQFVASCIGS